MISPLQGETAYIRQRDGCGEKLRSGYSLRLSRYLLQDGIIVSRNSHAENVSISLHWHMQMPFLLTFSQQLAS